MLFTNKPFRKSRRKLKLKTSLILPRKVIGFLISVAGKRYARPGSRPCPIAVLEAAFRKSATDATVRSFACRIQQDLNLLPDEQLLATASYFNSFMNSRARRMASRPSLYVLASSLGCGFPPIIFEIFRPRCHRQNTGLPALSAKPIS
jgi:hypothetical protein